MSLSASYLMHVFESMQCPAFFHDLQSKLIFVNDAYCREAGINEKEAIGKPYWEVFPRCAESLPNCKLKLHDHENLTSTDEFRVGNKVFFSYEFKIFDDLTNSPIFFHILTDITKRTEIELALEKIAHQFRALFEGDPDAEILLDGETFVDVNPAALTMFGCSNQSEILGQHFIKKFSPIKQPDGKDSVATAAEHISNAVKNGSDRFEWTHSKLDGTPFQTEVTLVAFERGGKRVVQGTIKDISQYQSTIDELRDIAFTDPLTQLSTRRLFEDRIHQVILKTSRSQKQSALLYIDLDHFKRLNDEFGHLVGDLRLQNVAKGLRSCVRSEDTVARLGGDEFAVLVNGLSPDVDVAKAHVVRVAEKIVKKLSTEACLAEPVKKPCQLDDISHCRCSASVGIVLFANDEINEKDLLKQADTAMYRAKKAGGDGYQFYE